MFLAAGRRLLISQDFGGQWQDVSDRLAGWPLFFDVAPDPEAPDHIYAATPWGLYRTVLQEGRRPWTPVQSRSSSAWTRAIPIPSTLPL
jgi:hypothetical protein